MSKTNDRIKGAIESSISVKNIFLQNEELLEELDEIITLLVEVFREKGKVFFCGNGGSAADAQHISAELSGKFNIDRDPLYAEALHVNTSYLTAVANDYGYEEIYARLVKAKCSRGDVVFGISTSGNSENIVKALSTAKQQGSHTIGLVGQNGGQMSKHCDYLIKVPSSETPRIQECHIMIGHIICENIEQILFCDES